MKSGPPKSLSPPSQWCASHNVAPAAAYITRILLSRNNRDAETIACTVRTGSAMEPWNYSQKWPTTGPARAKLVSIAASVVYFRGLCWTYSTPPQRDTSGFGLMRVGSSLFPDRLTRVQNTWDKLQNFSGKVAQVYMSLKVCIHRKIHA